MFFMPEYKTVLGGMNIMHKDTRGNYELLSLSTNTNTNAYFQMTVIS
jgi:hypothetical protein